jgi:hypothetical protein
MSGRSLVSVGVAILAVLVFLAPGSSAGQAPGKPGAKETGGKPLRTAWGDPDLQGTWSNSTIVPLQRPDELKGRELLTDEEVKERFQKHRQSLFAKRQGDTGFYNEFWWEWGKDSNRTSLIVDPPDGKLPPLTPQAQEAAKSRRLAMMVEGNESGGAVPPPASWLDMNSFDRCITRSLPGAMMPGFYGHYYQIFQTPDYVAIHIELIHDVRMIPLRGGPHIRDGIRQWLGDSRGRWEGDTLVVETTNFNGKVNDRAATVFGAGDDLRLIERFKRVDADTIDYQYTVTAPATFTRPWTALIPFHRAQEKVMEYACHEGNYAMRNILSGARADDAARQKSTAKP